MPRKYILQFLLIFISLGTYAQFSAPVTIDDNLPLATRHIITLDVNNDGLMDIIVSEYYSNINWYENTGSGFSSPQIITSTIEMPYFLDKSDFNGDGLTDLLVTNRGFGASIFINNGGGAPWEEIIVSDTLEWGATKSLFIDVENDGDQDVIINVALAYILHTNDGNGVFSSSVILQDEGECDSMTLGDFTNDGFTDLIVLGDGLGTRVYSNNTSGSFNPPISISNESTAFITSADLDNDGDIDMITGNPFNSNEVQIYENDGTGTFTFHHNEPNGNAQDPINTKLHLSDLNNNGYQDILYIYASEIFWKENDQSLNFINTSFLDNALSYTIVYADDIDNDGDNDIIWAGTAGTGPDPQNYTFHFGYIINESPLSISVETFQNEIWVYPNPTESIIQISNKIDFKEFYIHNSVGQIIISSNSNTIDMSSLKKDIYFLTIVFNDNTKKTVKIIRN